MVIYAKGNHVNNPETDRQVNEQTNELPNKKLNPTIQAKKRTNKLNIIKRRPNQEQVSRNEENTETKANQTKL